MHPEFIRVEATAVTRIDWIKVNMMMMMNFLSGELTYESCKARN